MTTFARFRAWCERPIRLAVLLTDLDYRYPVFIHVSRQPECYDVLDQFIRCILIQT